MPGRYGPYVKHGGVNATLPDKDTVESVTLREAVALLAAKAGRAPAKTCKAPRKQGKPVARHSARSAPPSGASAKVEAGCPARAAARGSS